MAELRNIVDNDNNILIIEIFQLSIFEDKILKWFGISLVGVLERNRGNFRDNLRVISDTNLPLRPGDYNKRFGISNIDRLFLIQSAFRCYD